MHAATSLLADAIDALSPHGVAVALAMGGRPNRAELDEATRMKVLALDRMWTRWKGNDDPERDEILAMLIEAGACSAAGVSTRLVLRHALENGVLPLLHAFLRQGHNFHHDPADLFGGHLATIRFLVEDAGMDPAAPLDNRGSPIHHAIKMQWTAHVRYFMAAGVSIESSDYQGNTPLITAAEYDCLDAVQCLLQAGARLSTVNFRGRSALHLATSPAIATALLDAGMPTDLADDSGLFPEDNESKPWLAALIQARRLHMAMPVTSTHQRRRL